MIFALFVVNLYFIFCDFQPPGYDAKKSESESVAAKASVAICGPSLTNVAASTNSKTLDNC